MTIDLKDKVVLITGASSGFGQDAARQFAQEGCKVVLAARRLDRLQAILGGVRYHHFVSALNEHGPVHIDNILIGRT